MVSSINALIPSAHSRSPHTLSHTPRVFEESLSVALLESQISSIESKTGATLVKRDARGHTAGVTLTGWSALLGIAALVVMLAASARYAWRSYAGVTDPSTVVLKSRQQHKYARVETAGS